MQRIMCFFALSCFLFVCIPTITAGSPPPVEVQSASVRAYSTGLDDLESPQIWITNPTLFKSYWTTSATFGMRGSASDNVAVSCVRWSNDRGGNGTCSGTSSWSLSGIALVQGKNLITISAFDTSGNKTDATLIVYYESSPVTLSGLRMVSCPIIPTSSDPKDLLGFSGTSWYAYDPVARAYAVYPDQSACFDPVESARGRGFWARFSSPQPLPPSGNIPPQDQPVSIRLLQGWNLIGNPFVSPLTWDTTVIQVRSGAGDIFALRDSANVVSNIAWSWNTGRNAYDLVADPLFVPGSPSSLLPWRAYWINAYTDCDLILPSPESQSAVQGVSNPAAGRRIGSRGLAVVIRR